MARPRKTHADKCRALIKGKVSFPDLNYMDYTASMGANLKVYNDDVDALVKKKSALLLWESQGKDISNISRLNKAWFHTVGAVSHMVLARGILLDGKDTLFIEEKYFELVKLAAKLPQHVDEEEVEIESEII